MEFGVGTFCIKPSIFIDNRSEHSAFCRDVVTRVEQLTG
jgi:hypothetical protein